MTTINWNDIYKRWQYLLSDIPITLESLFKFHEVPVDYLPSKHPHEDIDWWPNNEFDKLSALINDSDCLFSGMANAGTLHTVSELKRNSNSPEAQSAIWIAGSVWDKKHALPKSWRGETHQLLADIHSVIEKQFPEIVWWFHAVKWA